MASLFQQLRLLWLRHKIQDFSNTVSQNPRISQDATRYSVRDYGWKEVTLNFVWCTVLLFRGYTAFSNSISSLSDPYSRQCTVGHHIHLVECFEDILRFWHQIGAGLGFGEHWKLVIAQLRKKIVGRWWQPLCTELLPYIFS